MMNERPSWLARSCAAKIYVDVHVPTKARQGSVKLKSTHEVRVCKLKVSRGFEIQGSTYSQAHAFVFVSCLCLGGVLFVLAATRLRLVPPSFLPSRREEQNRTEQKNIATAGTCCVEHNALCHRIRDAGYRASIPMSQVFYCSEHEYHYPCVSRWDSCLKPELSRPNLSASVKMCTSRSEGVDCLVGLLLNFNVANSSRPILS